MASHSRWNMAATSAREALSDGRRYPFPSPLMTPAAMQKCMASVIGCDPDAISIKATTTERLGFTGRQEGISAYAVALIEK